MAFKEFMVDPYTPAQHIALEQQEMLLGNATINMPKANQRFITMEMRRVLNDDQMFDGFIRQLLNEYSAELLFSVIEFSQFKKKIENEHINIAFAV
eukprot:365496_1